VRRLRDHRTTLAAAGTPEVVYVDLDGTLLGPGGSLFAGLEEAVTSRAADALAGMHRAGVTVVPMSGRTEEQVREVARVIGARGFIAELGGVVSREGAVEHRHGDAPGGSSPADAMLRSGGPGLLVERLPGRLVPHTPWSDLHRDATLLFRGNVDLGEVAALLDRCGYGWMVLHDNGIIRRDFDDVDADEVHAYHLAPRGVSKAAAVAHDVRARGIDPLRAAVVGDSPADADAGAEVGTCFLVANGAWVAEGSTDDGPYVTDAAYGDGFAEAVDALGAGP